MKSLETLIKLQKTKVDEHRVFLLKLQEQLAVIDAQLAEQERQRKAQEDLLHREPGLGLTYGEYLKHYLAMKKALQKKRNATEYAVNLAREKLAELFEEQKRYEIAEQDRLDEEEREEQRRETHTLDEVGSVSFVRKRKKRER